MKVKAKNSHEQAKQIKYFKNNELKIRNKKELVVRSKRVVISEKHFQYLLASYFLLATG